MKTIGLLGGMSWESTQTYYRLINEQVRQQLGGLHSARLLLYSVDFADIEALQHRGEWDATAQILLQAAQALERGGADFLLIATNTMHKVAPQISAGIHIPLLHIADATASVLQSKGVSRVGLLGTRFTMEQDFYRQRLSDAGIDVLIPEEKDRSRIHQVIYEELCQGVISDTSRQRYLNIINDLRRRGAEAVILGCTEISLLLDQSDTDTPLYDTTAIHAREAVKLALQVESEVTAS